MSLPEVTEEPHFNFSSFRVAGKIFVTVPPEGTHVHIFVDEEVRERALVLHSNCVQKLLWGGKVRGLRVALAPAKSAVVNPLICVAWRAKAPKRLADLSPPAR